ncbi:uncharacterized protein LOC127751931, partial [Frankliniella occidentalis]|uniref:Uncharacterized protein LOC127751931 n=1 Tax=Frankliniella occidentalis TaxID=133901 RepID=A0A9C6XAG2_FRAOC
VADGEVRVCLFSAKFHKGVVTSDLRVIRHSDTLKSSLLTTEDVGKFWCRNCRTRQPQEPPKPNNPPPRSSRLSGSSSGNSAQSSTKQNTEGNHRCIYIIFFLFLNTCFSLTYKMNHVMCFRG